MLWPVLLLFLLSQPLLSKGDGAQMLDDLLMEGSVGEAECDALIHAIADQDMKSVVDPKPRLLGHWVSQQCETRDGPEYILQSLSFFSNVSFQYITHYYKDSECRHPVVSMELKGVLSSREGDCTYDIRHLRVLHHENVRNSRDTGPFPDSCLRFGKAHYKRGKIEIVFRGSLLLSEDCAHVFTRQLPEMCGVTTLTRSVEARKVKKLLLKDRDGVRRYGPPLVLIGKLHDKCPTCHALSHSSLHTPPHLPRRPQPPPEVSGEWVSAGCETLPSGVHLTRRVTFSSLHGTWRKHTALFLDAACIEQYGAGHTYGYFSTGAGDVVENALVDGAYNLEMKETCACIKWGSSTAQKRQPHECDPDADGCKRVSQTHHTIFKMHFNSQGAPALLLGHRGRRNVTSFQPPLLQCTLFPALY